MSTLIFDSPDHVLSLSDSLLHISHPKQGVKLLSLMNISRIVIGKGNSLSTDLQIKFTELGKEIVLLGHKTSALIINPSQVPNNLRLLQYQAIKDNSLRCQLAFALIEARRQGQNKVLKHMGMPIIKATSSMPENLMLFEAQMSRKYWRAWANLFGNEGFQGRERQPPQDPINALLSLTSTMEDSNLSAPLLAEGFDLALGIHHAVGYQRPSLVLDIKELTRAELELWIIKNWQARVFHSELFEQTELGCRLSKSGQQVFYPAWFSWQKKRRQALRRLAKLCRHRLERECHYA